MLRAVEQKVQNLDTKDLRRSFARGGWDSPLAFFVPVFFLIVCCSGFASVAVAQDDDVDHLELGGVLIRDGLFDRAERVLKKIDPEDHVDQGRLDGLWGMIALHRKQYDKARRFFKKSLEDTNQVSEIYLYLTDLEVQSGNVEQAKAYLVQIQGEWTTKLPFFLLSAEIHWKSGEQEKAWKLLGQAEQRKLGAATLLKKKFQYLLDAKLLNEARKLGALGFQKGLSAQEIVAMSVQLRKAGADSGALQLMEMARFRWPKNELVHLELTQTYLSMGQRFTAALVLEEASRQIPSLAFEASELLRQEGKAYRAHHLNMMTLDPSNRVKQHLALSLESEDYSAVKSLLPQVLKLNLLENEEIRYAMAYSLYQEGDLGRSLKMLSGIQKDNLFQKAVELRREIQKCSENSWSCHETI